MSDVLKISVPGKLEYVGTIRLAISSLANCAGFDIEAIEDIKVAVSEACSNVVNHGCAKGADFYEVSCEVYEDRMVICIEDFAGGYDVDLYREPNLNDPKEGGLGIYIMKALMDEVLIRSAIGEGTRIQLIKYI